MNKLIIVVVLIGACTAQNLMCSQEMKENKMCTKEFVPVCGVKLDQNNQYSQSKATYSNKCVACSEGIEFYAEGSCDQYPKQATFCHPEAHLNKACTREFMPVCGLFDSSIMCINSPCGENYPNKCNACINQQVAFFLSGFCNQHKKFEM